MRLPAVNEHLPKVKEYYMGLLDFVTKALPALIEAGKDIYVKERDIHTERWRIDQQRQQQQESLSFRKWCLERSQEFERYIEISKHEWQQVRDEKLMAFAAWCEEQKQRIQWELKAYERETVRQSDERKFAFQRWRFEQEKEWQRQLAIFDYEIKLEIAVYERQTAMQSIEFQRQLDNFPLKISPSQLLEPYQQYQSGRDKPIPLLILLSPPHVDFEGIQDSEFPPMEKRLSEGIRQFLSNYSEEERPIKFLGGAWESKRLHSETAAEMLFGILKAIPTLVLESEIDGDYLNFRIAFWKLGQGEYVYKPIISRLPYRQILYEYAKADALEWQLDREKYLKQGKSEQEVMEIGGVDEVNLKTVNREETGRSLGIVRENEYRITSKHIERLFESLTICHCLIAGCIIDIHYLTGPRKIPPLLPQLLPKLVKDACTPKLIKDIITEYYSIYAETRVEMPYWMPELYLELALHVTDLDKSLVKEQIKHALDFWLQLHPDLQCKGGDDLETVIVNLQIDNQSYTEKLRDCLRIVGDKQHAIQLSHILNTWYEQKITGEIRQDERGPIIPWF
jgi:hypothetical protein